jgi:hypothetical protein
VADVLVGSSCAVSWHSGQQRLGTIERLNPDLLVHTQHQRIFWRIQIQADNVQQLGFKIEIWAEGKSAKAVGYGFEATRV